MNESTKLLLKIQSILEIEKLNFLQNKPNLIPEFEILSTRVINFIITVNPNDIELKITQDENMFIFLQKGTYECWMELFIENDNDTIEGIAKIYDKNILHRRIYGKHDLILSEVKEELE